MKTTRQPSKAARSGLKVTQVPISEIHPYPGNPRVNDNAVAPVAESIEKFGFRSPIIVDRNHVIICGHTRLKAAQRLGLDSVPVHVAEDLSAEQVKALRLVDNRTGELSTWDLELLGVEIEGLRQADFAMDNIGFSDLELSQILGNDDPIKDGSTDPDSAPETPAEPLSRIGEIYILGRHRVMCGDSTDRKSLAALLNGKIADLWLTDPPYNVNYVGGGV